MKSGFSVSLWLFLAILIFMAISCSTGDEGGADDPRFAEADSLIQAALSDDQFTGVVLLIGEKGEIVHHKAYGYASLYNEDLRVIERPDSMSREHLFDLASLTKIFATTYAVMALHTDGMVELDDPISRFLPGFDNSGHSSITIRQLLNHTSGLRPWYPLYYLPDRPDERLEAIRSLPLSGVPGENRQYSDLGYILLEEIIESISGMSFEAYLNERVYSRLGL
ncbi:MAG: serine hydrolase domain-containing protein, partial [Balneolaceae bacterium]|nr:serine hydrolase domain-containing protein [Balneolaceae bacterium]